MAGSPSRHGEKAQSFALPADASAARVARAHTRRWLSRWNLPKVVEPLPLVVSELVGNAVRYGRPPFRLLLRRTRQGVRVDVHDEAAESVPDLSRPVMPSGPDAEGGRGLLLVDAVSTDAGVDQIPNDGKRVWAEVDDAAEQ